MTRFYYADGHTHDREVDIPDDAVIYLAREPSVAFGTGTITLVERAFYRRRYAMNRGFYGPVPADDWHENGCPCRGCVARYHPVEEERPCVGFANGCACDACYLRGGQ